AISRCPRKSCSMRLMCAPWFFWKSVRDATLLAQRRRHKGIGAAVVGLALPSGNQDFRRAGFGGIGAETLALLVTLALAELVGAELAVGRARGHRTGHAPLDHRARLEPRQRVARILHRILGARVEIVDRLAGSLHGRNHLVEQLAHLVDQAGILRRGRGLRFRGGWRRRALLLQAERWLRRRRLRRGRLDRDQQHRQRDDNRRNDPPAWKRDPHAAKRSRTRWTRKAGSN